MFTLEISVVALKNIFNIVYITQVQRVLIAVVMCMCEVQQKNWRTLKCMTEDKFPVTLLNIDYILLSDVLSDVASATAVSTDYDYIN